MGLFSHVISYFVDCLILDAKMEQPLYFENFDLENVVTPVDAEALETLLHDTNYDSVKTKFLVDGFKHGFSLEYAGPTDVKQKALNLKLPTNMVIEDRITVSQTTLWNKVMKEVEAK